jgi:hypothetical protein
MFLTIIRRGGVRTTAVLFDEFNVTLLPYLAPARQPSGRLVGYPPLVVGEWTSSLVARNTCNSSIDCCCHAVPAGGEAVEIKAGDVATFPAGMSCT